MGLDDFICFSIDTEVGPLGNVINQINSLVKPVTDDGLRYTILVEVSRVDEVPSQLHETVYDGVRLLLGTAGPALLVNK